jgi:hypothetical protein
MARYGATTLAPAEWYHVAGVYDAEAQTLDVYLNGELDNGFLLGSVTHAQQSSPRAALYVGRRSDLEDFGFVGSIDDVRIYSLALTKTEIAADMRGEVIDQASLQHVHGSGVNRRPSVGLPIDQCASHAVLSEPDDITIPLAAAMLGALVAVACVGLWPSVRSPFHLIMSFAVGLLFVATEPSTLPSFSRYMMPLVSVAGGASVAISVRRQNV